MNVWVLTQGEEHYQPGVTRVFGGSDGLRKAKRAAARFMTLRGPWKESHNPADGQWIWHDTGFYRHDYVRIDRKRVE